MSRALLLMVSNSHVQKNQCSLATLMLTGLAALKLDVLSMVIQSFLVEI